jgi:16S rRNA (cytosine1402-N4)-methyltransferase
MIARALPTGRLIALDRDPSSVAAARGRLSSFPGVTVLHRNYAKLAAVLREQGISKVDGILLDAGISSMQLDDPSRGFSFKEEGPLDMRLDPTQGITAAEYLAGVDEAELVRVLRRYGDVGPARRIARSILRRRETRGIATTRDLAEAVGEALSFVTGFPEETRTVFQALRVVVNEELRWLEAGLRQAIDSLKAGGRLVAIAFHSGEDRVIKQVLREASRPRRELYPDGRVRTRTAPSVKVLTPKPLRPTDEEVRQNPRSHSACMRVAERLG